MKNLLKKIQYMVEVLRDEIGQDLLEYALVIALIVLAAMVGAPGFANQISNALNNVGGRVQNCTAANGTCS